MAGPYSRLFLRQWITPSLGYAGIDENIPTLILQPGLVALPFCHVTLRARKPLPPGYPHEPKTFGDHVKKRRLDLGLTQTKVAEILGVSRRAVGEWEFNRVLPTVSLIPKVIEFLGYVPFDDLSGMSEGERIITSRRPLGLTQAEMAERLGVCTTTFVGWEKGEGVSKKRYTDGPNWLFTSACSVGRNAQ